MFANHTFELVKRIVLDKLSCRETVTVPGISELTGISTTTISKHIGQMVAEHYLEEVGIEKQARKGRRAVVYGVEPDSRYFIGIEVRNACLGVGLIDFAGNIVKMDIDDNYRFENTHTNFALACSKVRKFIDLVEEDKRDRIVSVGMALGGRVDFKSGTSCSIFNFEETLDTSLADYLSESFGMPAFIENDTKALAYADYLATGKKWPNVLYVNVGWGIGLGIIIEGELYYGSNGYSGEFGHVRTYDNNIMCHCGKVGCLETEVSGQAILRKLTEKVHAGANSVLAPKIRKGIPITENDILNATEQEDPVCIELVSGVGRELGKQLAGMINIFNPDCIIIGGKLARVSPFYFQQQVAVSVKQYSLKLVSKNLSIITSPLGPNAGIIGAGICARKGMYFY